MKSLEAFTLGKRVGQPELNEDSLVVVPDAGYAVIDGVTDRNGTRYNGMLAGRFASRAVARTFEGFLLGLADGSQSYTGPEAFVALMTEAVAQGYRDGGVYKIARQDSSIRAGCAVVACFTVGESLEVVAVGDSGIRINGGTITQALKPLDDVTSRLRQEAWRYFEELGTSAEDCDRFAGSLTWRGTRHQPGDLPTARPEVRDEIEARALAVNRKALPNVPEWELVELVHGGIAHGQGQFQNAGDLALGYGVIDGFPVPAKFIEASSIPLNSVETIELFSDGYFQPAEGFGVAAWEAAFERVETEDPHKIGRYLSTKGSTASVLADDRTYLGVRLK